jgi:hypothetical protein
LYDTCHWQRRRALQLQFEPLCEWCKGRGRIKKATVVDHIEPHKGDRNKFYLGRLQSLCVRCHSRDKQRVEVRGYSDDIDEHGWPTDPRYPANKVR